MTFQPLEGVEGYVFLRIFRSFSHVHTHTHTHKRSTLNVLLVAKFSTASVRFSFVSLNGAKSVGAEGQNTRATKLGNGRNYSRRKLHTFYYQRQLSKLQLQTVRTPTGRENATCHTAFLTSDEPGSTPPTSVFAHYTWGFFHSRPQNRKTTSAQATTASTSLHRTARPTTLGQHTNTHRSRGRVAYYG